MYSTSLNYLLQTINFNYESGFKKFNFLKLWECSLGTPFCRWKPFPTKWSCLKAQFIVEKGHYSTPQVSVQRKLEVIFFIFFCRWSHSLGAGFWLRLRNGISSQTCSRIFVQATNHQWRAISKKRTHFGHKVIILATFINKST